MGYVFGKADHIALKERRASKVAGWSEYLVLGLCVKYVEGDSDLRNLLVLNKRSSQIIRDRVLKQALLLSQPERLPEKRLNLWSQLLDLPANQTDYYAYKKEVEEYPELILNVEEVI